ncbi:MAG: H-NS histone family protein [Variovorax sp.]|jgi:DNA-binding protein H-NS|nr:MAG: H-NS histone family protein [Variovorax sp.]
MSKTYPELKTEIARLNAEAERVRQFELPAVIAELNQLIEHYELTEAMIFDSSHKQRPGKPRTVLVPRYIDETSGNTWSGRGSKPAWVSEALSAGTLAENLLIS